MEVILFAPDIPQNTGNIVRTCALTGTPLTLVRPLGFSLSSRHLKRAGLDYFNEIEITIIDSLEENLSSSFYFFSSKSKRLYTEIDYKQGDQLIFGSETKGLPPSYFERWPANFYTIPMIGGKRCLNLSNAVAIVLYEAWRQLNFRGLDSPSCAKSLDLLNRPLAS